MVKCEIGIPNGPTLFVWTLENAVAERLRTQRLLGIKELKITGMLWASYQQKSVLRRRTQRLVKVYDDYYYFIVEELWETRERDYRFRATATPVIKSAIGIEQLKYTVTCTEYSSA